MRAEQVMLLEYHVESDTVSGLPTVKHQNYASLNVVEGYFALM